MHGRCRQPRVADKQERSVVDGDVYMLGHGTVASALVDAKSRSLDISRLVTLQIST